MAAGAGWTAAGGDMWPASARNSTLIASPAHPAHAGWAGEASLSSLSCLQSAPGTPPCKMRTGAHGMRLTSAANLTSAGGDELGCLTEESRHRRSGLHDELNRWLVRTPPVGVPRSTPVAPAAVAASGLAVVPPQAHPA